MSAEISIIIPIYNYVPMVSKCIESIINQSFKNFICYLINTNNSDAVYNTCKAYAQIDTRFKVVAIKASNASMSMNYAINIAKSKYLLFVNINEKLKQNMLEKLYTIAESSMADVCISNYKINNIEYSGLASDANFFSVDKEEAIASTLSTKGISQSLCCKLIKRNKIKGVYFDDSIYLNEDVLFLVSVFLRSQNIVCINDVLCNVEKDNKICSLSSYYKRELSGLLATTYIMKGLESSSSHLKIIGVKYTVNQAIQACKDIVNIKCTKTKEIKTLIKKICRHYLNIYIRQTDINIKNKAMCILLLLSPSIYIHLHLAKNKLINFAKFIKLPWDRIIFLINHNNKRLTRSELKIIKNKISINKKQE